ncbi:MAG TPA: hypothetical protein VNP98_17420 [Chthoniobacterales bacterium]|nr:hypothetical protein [Chthoniobacterales bacterium]
MIDRLVISRGPAMVTHRGGVFFSKEDIVVDLNHETKGMPSSAFGELTQVRQGVKATTKFRPVGEFEHLGVLFPYASTPIGASIFGDADYPLLIQPLDDAQAQTTFKAAALSKMPDLSFTATDTLLGDCEFQMIGANNTAPESAERLFAQAANAIDLEALPYDPTQLIVQAYAARWLSAGTWLPSYDGNAATGGGLASLADAATVQTKLRTIAFIDDVTVTGNYYDGFVVTDPDNDIDATDFAAAFTDFPGGTALKATQVSARVVKLELTPWSNFETREGIKVAFGLTLTEDTGDAAGHYDTAFGGLTVTATGLPQGITEAQMLAAAVVQGTNSGRGRRLSTGAHDLDIVGDGVFFRLYAANLRKAGQIFGATKQRIPDLEWVTSRSIGAGGVLNPLFYIGTAAP